MASRGQPGFAAAQERSGLASSAPWRGGLAALQVVSVIRSRGAGLAMP